MNTGALWDAKLLKLRMSFNHVKVYNYNAWLLHFMVLDGFGKHHTSQKVIINYQKGFQFLKTRGIEAPSNHTPNWVQ